MIGIIREINTPVEVDQFEIDQEESRLTTSTTKEGLYPALKNKFFEINNANDKNNEIGRNNDNIISNRMQIKSITERNDKALQNEEQQALERVTISTGEEILNPAPEDKSEINNTDDENNNIERERERQREKRITVI